MNKNKCQTCYFALWNGDMIIGCARVDCELGIVLYDD